MAQTDALKKYLDAGMAFTQLTRKRAEQVVKELVAAGELQRSQAKEAIDELVDRSKRNAEVLADQVRKEVESQLAHMGLARKAAPAPKANPETKAKPEDRVKPEAEVAIPPARKPRAKDAGGADGPADVPAKKAPAKKAPAKKAPATAEVGISGELPGRRAKAAAEGDATPAKKAAKVIKKQG